ncbi:MAG: ATP-dependent sacrificial sulfur transferase LarE [Clostridiales bacterium]|nr:ATP-dependent sacrificial sulfur transferase LarE [Clostridiales bacterium]
MNKINEELLPAPLREKWRKLAQALASKNSLLVACSGGVDSGFLLYAAAAALNGRMLAVTAAHPLMKKADIEAACETAGALGISWQALPLPLLQKPEVAQNSPERCYHCKKMVFSALLKLAKENGLACVADGKNADDEQERRPGNRAALELGVWQPLFEAGLTKEDIRQLARAAGLKSWNRPASPCLATRFPYNTALTPEDLSAVEKGEEILNEAGFATVRLRHHGHICRIEIPKEELPLLAEKTDVLTPLLRELGFTYICADLGGFKSGSMDSAPVKTR